MRTRRIRLFPVAILLAIASLAHAQTPFEQAVKTLAGLSGGKPTGAPRKRSSKRGTGELGYIYDGNLGGAGR